MMTEWRTPSLLVGFWHPLKQVQGFGPIQTIPRLECELAILPDNQGIIHTTRLIALESGSEVLLAVIDCQ
jgi:hypothetical protein